MTCIVAVEDRKTRTVVLAADSQATATHGGAKSFREDTKVWTAGRWAFAYCGSPRMAQVLRYNLDLAGMRPGKDFPAFCATTLVDAIRTALRDAGCLAVNEGQQMIPGGLLIAYGAQVVAMYADFQIEVTSEGHAALGSGAAEAKGSLHATAGTRLSAETRARRAVEAACHYNSTVGGQVRTVRTRRARDTVRPVSHTP